MSTIAESTTSRVTSILKSRKSTGLALDAREKLKESILNKVRFSFTNTINITQILESANAGDRKNYDEYLVYLKKTELEDEEVLRLIKQSRDAIPLFKSRYVDLLRGIFDFNCFKRDTIVIEEFQSFLIDLLVAHNRFTAMVVEYLLSFWVPSSVDLINWQNGSPSAEMQITLGYINSFLHRLVDLIPLTFDIIIESIEKLFPYHTKPPHVIAGYVENILTLVDMKPVFQLNLIQLVITKLLVLDVNATRDQIEDAVLEEDVETNEGLEMKLPIAEALDLCIVKLCNYVRDKVSLHAEKNSIFTDKLFNVFLRSFEMVVLPSHNPLHVQFLIFYICSLKMSYAESLLKLLWNKVCNPNMGTRTRQISIGYIASFISRAKYLPLRTVKAMLKEICTWAHQYIERSDAITHGSSLKAHCVFHSVCQAIFYVIAFRSRQLTDGNQNLNFLQNLHLSSLVSCPMNPLRVCLPTIVQAFAGITRAYQLAYCHTVIEKNIRKRLATVYLNKNESVEEMLETFFPFDPCLLKRVNEMINPIYLQYQQYSAGTDVALGKRPRYESVTSENDDDDFLIEYKKQKIYDFHKSFSYGIQPGFHK